MRAKVKKPKKKPNVKVIIGAIGAVCVIGAIGNLVDGNSSSEQASTTAYEVTSESAFNFIEETSSIKYIENNATKETTTVETTSETLTTAESTTEASTTESATIEIITLETTTEETSVEETAIETTTIEPTLPVETTTQVVAETTTEITTTTEAITEPPATEPATTANVGDELVWVSETGKKYHSKNNCYPMNPDNARQVTKNEAVNELGLEPCGKCYK